MIASVQLSLAIFVNLMETLIKFSYLNVNLLLSICISIYFSSICIRKYMIKRVFITSYM